MMTRLAPFAAGVSILGLLAWVFLSGSDDDVGGPERPTFPDGDPARSVERSPASAVPCAAPLAWRIARVDPDFGIGVREARAAAEEAASLWEEATGRRLFVPDSVDGFPIRLVYGEAQERAKERRRREGELREERRRLEARRRELSLRSEELAADAAAHEDRVREFRERLAEHNAEVRRRNRTRSAPDGVLAALRRSERALERERRELNDGRRALEDRERAIRHEEERLDRLVRAYERRVEELERAFPTTPVEAGAYREVVREEDGRVTGARREIRVYRFGSRQDLVRVLAHEMGHAQGLGHTDASGSLMSEEYGARDDDGPPAPGSADLELLRERCPGL